VTGLLLLLTSLGGGLGAVCRFVLDGVIRTGLRPRGSGPAPRVPDRRARGFPEPVPWPTITVNVSGSLALGVLMGLSAAAALPTGWSVVVGTGFLGGYTTFSTASVEAVGLLRAGRWTAAAATAGGVLLVGTAAAGLGLWAGALIA